MALKETPMLKQYRRIKAELAPGVILFFRLGDFYEMFYEDAKAAAGVLEIALTKRNGMPMCGVPYHAAEQYLAKLIRAGMKVAICDQVEDPSQAKGVVEREVTRIVTPGTVTEDRVLDSARHNFLAGLYRDGEHYSVALLDLSTGAFRGETRASVEELRDMLLRAGPSECAVPGGQLEAGDFHFVSQALGTSTVTACENWTFDVTAARDYLQRHFGVRSLAGFGCDGEDGIVAAAGGVLHYVREDLRRKADHVRGLRVVHASDYMLLDETTCRNLDLVPMAGRRRVATVLGTLDSTRTAMGARLIRDWLLQPLAEMASIHRRQEVVQAFVSDRILMAEMREALGGVRDMERLIARIGSGTGSARDLLTLGQSLSVLPAVRDIVADPDAPLLASLRDRIEPLPEVADLLARAIVDEPPASLKEGGVIRDGYSAELDELRGTATEGRSWLARYQAAEQERTGIKNLKIRHNKVFGYYIEVSKANLDNVPGGYVRKQTLVNAERFITPELKTYENKVFGAHEKAVALEHELLASVREQVAAQTPAVQASAEAVAQLDVLSALAERALSLGYVCPVVNDSGRLAITNGRHPVVENMADAERFVPNDALLDCQGNQLIIITGPNMAGKSTYIRQVGLIVVMAQIGSFVPVEAAEIGLVDRVFTRVGASDDLSRGRSTFMVEMEETANILNSATPRSLVILDEIGRGTSTFDGISIAWAVAEYLHNTAEVKAKTLFATHYHELTDLALTMDGVCNYNVLAREEGETVVFLRKIVPGGADKSYGIQVARLAGLPDAVIDRAREILGNLEEGELGDTGQPKIAKRRARKRAEPVNQLDLFDS